MTGRAVYEIPGDRIASLEDFYREIGEAINGPGGYFGRNLDAFNDCLAGGFGTPEGGYVLRWRHSDRSREALGYPETVRQLERKLERCHPANRDAVREELERARRREGPTVFDWLVEIIRDAEPWGVRLELR
ncbi:MAG TPA: barstar family protein [Chloroflexota bacterium]|jgi:RNAse (barnase) inhibitor barstar|nr:barstar family protein [Chloroflexota bacterium]